ncbi:MAG TPA: gliding motility-associated C-terminal domain-containing protein [Bacteroidia bacterium]|nr:gliding motility-associated C-terminal domain-containing protein [Bacteroidia bacterium]
MKKLAAIYLIVCVYAGRAQVTPMSATIKTYAPDCNLGAAKVTVTGGKPPYFYRWSNGALGDTVSSLTEGNYTIHISDSDTSHITPEINVSFSIAAPVCQVGINNKFSPNGDGINDLWTISRTEYYPKFFLQVFDRWGQVVHQQRGTFTPWDGTHLGVHLPDATYYVIFFYEEGVSSKYQKGSVTILR